MLQESTVLLGKVRHDTQIQLLFQDDSSPSPNDVNDVNDANDANDANDTNPPQSLDTLVGGLEEP